jgi:GNAT superfamily N-acetyltransferase
MRAWVGEVAGTMVGFLSVIVGSLDPVEHRPRGAELPRIYILGSAQRMGLGPLLVHAAVTEAAVEGPSYVWHDVMASADRALRAYANWGFHELGSKRFEKAVKAGLSGMVVLAKEINALQARLSVIRRHHPFREKLRAPGPANEIGRASGAILP